MLVASVTLVCLKKGSTERLPGMVTFDSCHPLRQRRRRCACASDGHVLATLGSEAGAEFRQGSLDDERECKTAFVKTQADICSNKVRPSPVAVLVFIGSYY
eukprot:672305-Pleurochrysis_carterae.AAC.4